MSDHSDIGPFTVIDLDTVARLVLNGWTAAADLDWSVPAGTLTWSCLQTADHVIDCVFSYALFFASRKQDAYPNFGELHALPDATPRDMIDGLRAVTTMLVAVIATAPSDTTAVMLRFPTIRTGGPNDFAARGALEMILHGYDISAGLGLDFPPPDDLCGRLFAATVSWPQPIGVVASSDPWADIVERSGRPRPR